MNFKLQFEVNKIRFWKARKWCKHHQGQENNKITHIYYALSLPMLWLHALWQPSHDMYLIISFSMKVIENNPIFSIISITDSSETFISALKFFTGMPYKILGLLPNLEKPLTPYISSLFPLLHQHTSSAGNQRECSCSVCLLALHFRVMMVKGVCTMGRSTTGSLFYPQWLATS